MTFYLAGDIGGTKTALALFDEKRGADPLYFESFPSQNFPDFHSVVSAYLSHVGDEKKISRAAFAIAGPVKNQQVKATNLPWHINAQRLTEALGFEVVLLNDLEASGWGLELLSKEMLFPLSKAKGPFVGNRAICSPGTGLGEAALFFDGKSYHPFATEGGHSDFAPQGELQIDLLKYLSLRFGHVSYERILSGPGFPLLYDFFLQAKGRKADCDLKGGEEMPSHIVSHALAKDSALCLDVLELFVTILAQEAANCALKFYAMGGLYLGGGIPPKILQKLREPLFIENFLNKGRFRALLEAIPVYVILDPASSLKGAFNFLRKR